MDARAIRYELPHSEDLSVEALAMLQADIDRGLADLTEGLIKDFDAKSIIERGRKLLIARSLST